MNAPAQTAGLPGVATHLQLVGKALHLDARAADGRAVRLLKALGNETRMAILLYLGDRVVSVNRIAEDLGLPPSTATMHVAILERAGLIVTDLRPATRGLQKVCARTYDELVIDLAHGTPTSPMPAFEATMPVGGYSDFDVRPSCGMANVTGLIGFLDDPASFYEPERFSAQLVWFRYGWVEYRFPNRLPPSGKPRALQITAEVCSEAPLHDADWPSDISVWVNGVHLGAWTSPGDFGGVRGRLTPPWWEEKDSQFGALKRWRVTGGGTTIDGVPLSGIRLEDLGLAPGEPIAVRIGVRGDAEHVGGINLFGRAFGNYPQDLELRIEYEMDRRAVTQGDGRGEGRPIPEMAVGAPGGSG